METLRKVWGVASFFFLLLEVARLPANAQTSGSPVIAWGQYPSTVVTDAVSAVSGIAYDLIIRSNGSLVALSVPPFSPPTIPAALSNIAAVSIGPSHTLALRSNGTVVAWGSTDNGKLAVPLNLTNAIGIAAGYYHSLALRRDGTVVGWGNNTYGQATPPPNLSNVVAIAAGEVHSLALKSNGIVVGWGSDSNIFQYFGAKTPPPGLSNVIAIASGSVQAVALKSDGTVVGWGHYGDGLANPPVGLSNVVAIAAGTFHSLALRADGTVVGWVDYLLGAATPPPELSGVVTISGGAFRTTVITRGPGIARAPMNQTVLAGDNAQFTAEPAGNGPFLFQWKYNGSAIAGATNSSLIITNAQAVHAGGYSISVTNAFGSIASKPAMLTVQPSGPRILTQPASVGQPAGTTAMLDVQAVGTAPLNYQWRFSGQNLSGSTSNSLVLSNLQALQQGFYDVVISNAVGVVTSASAYVTTTLPFITLSPRTFLTRVGGTIHFSVGSVSPTNVTYQWFFAGAAIAGATNTDLWLSNAQPANVGQYWVVITNTYGAVTSSAAPLLLMPVIHPSLVIAWGWNYNGQTNVPPDLTNAVAASAGEFHSVALRADGVIVNWGGTNTYGGPIGPLTGLSNVVALVAGGYHNVALRSDGTVVCWGAGATEAERLRVVPEGLTNVVAISAGEGHSLALKADGTVVDWRLQDLDDTPIPPSTLTIGLTDLVAIEAGWEHNLGLLSDGTVAAWREPQTNPQGLNVPTNLTGVVSVAAGDGYSLALKNDGTIVGWGNNPTIPQGLSNVVAIAAGSGHSLAVRADGSVLAWGYPFDNALEVPKGLFYPSVVSSFRSHSLALTAAPFIVQPPTNLVVAPHLNATFAVVAKSAGPMRLQWQFNGAAIAGETNSVLTIPNVGFGNAGNYSVVLSNQFYWVTSSLARLDVYPFNPLSSPVSTQGAGQVVWGDYDNDGRLDLLIAGETGTRPTTATPRLFHNNGGGNFNETNVDFPSPPADTVAWGDFDNNGFLDMLIVSGSAGTIWRNNGDGSFTNLNLTLGADYETVASLADYNNDGKLDILLGGRLYRNLGNNQFTNVNAGLPIAEYSVTAWGDYDGDGLQDVLICGLLHYAFGEFRLFRNKGDGTFTNVNAGFPDIYRGMGAWLDFDADGRPDVLMSGETNERYTALHRNNGDGTFTEVTSNLPATTSARLALGDCDNDGQPDVFLSGNDGTNFSGKLFRGQADGLFVPVASPFPTNESPFASWGDYDSDGRLDLALGIGNANVALYRNDTTIPNTPPSAPAPTAAMAGVNSVSFQWGPGSDAQTPQPTLTYGLRVGRTSGTCDVLAADAATNGTRRVARPGNAGSGRSLTLTNLAFGRYYWAVQAVDSAFAGSPFTIEQVFTHAAATLPASGVTSSEATLNGMLDTNIAPAAAWFEWGTTTNHGGSTILQNLQTNAASASLTASIAGLLPGTKYFYRLVVTNADGIYYGGEQSLITTDLPHIVPLAASGITASNATLNALVNPNGAATSVSFEYGLTRSYGASTTISNIGAGRGLVSVSRTIGGLIGGQVYHFRVVATNDVGLAYSADLTFTTSTEPEAFTLAANNIGATSAQLNASVRPNTFPTSVLFEYGGTTNLGSLMMATNLPGLTNLLAVGMPLTGLTRLTTSYFRVVASNATGLTRGAVLSFKTTNDVITLPPGNLTMTSATLNGLVNPNGQQTSVVFQYGQTTNFSNVTAEIILGAFTNLTPVSYPLNGLLSNATYFVRVVATNSDGVRFSTPLSFQTLPLFSVFDLGVSGAANGSAAWGDYDNDGKLDLIIIGQGVSRLYRNLGIGTFTLVSTSIVGVTSGTVAWGDYNSDGWLDVLVVGTSSGSSSSRIYRNNGNGTFTDILANLQPVGLGVGRWGDYDNDGRQDVLLVGQTNSQPFAKIYRNQGGGVFTNLNVTLPAYLDAHAITLDYDNDGWLDVLLMGRVGVPYADVYAKLYRNNGGGVFQDSGVVLPGVRLGFADWGDFDGDGFADLLYGGNGTNLSDVIYLFRNNGNGTFSNLSNLVPQFAPDAAPWGDYDNDGRPDIFVRGQKYYSSIVPSNSYSAVIHNNGNNPFTRTYFPLPEIWSSAGGLADYDTDGRLDVVITGTSRTGTIIRFYRNNSPQTNTPPAAPNQLASAVSSNAITFSWAQGSDAESPSAGLSYNLKVGRTSGGVEIVPPLSGSNGLRRVVAPGNVGHARGFTLTNLPPGAYYWSVQAIDPAFAGSPFAPEQGIIIAAAPLATTVPATNVTSSAATLLASVVANGSQTVSYFAWGETTNLINLTGPILLAGDFATNQISARLTNLFSGDSYRYRIVASNALGVVYGAERQVRTVYPAMLSGQRVGNTLQINFNGSPGAMYEVLASTNLINWFLAGQATLISSNQFRFVDSLSTNYPARFYRISSP